jgi:hypothetical protein
MFREASKEEPTSKKKNLLTSENKKNWNKNIKNHILVFLLIVIDLKIAIWTLTSVKQNTFFRDFLRLLTCVCCHKILNFHLRLFLP